MILTITLIIILTIQKLTKSAEPPQPKLQSVEDSTTTFFTLCDPDQKLTINIRWFKPQSSTFQTFDTLDPTWTGTGIKRSIRSSGCIKAVLNRWYWIGIAATKLENGSGNCYINSTFRMEGETYNGACDPTDIHFWDGIKVTETEVSSGFQKKVYGAYGKGFRVNFNRESESLNGEDLSFLIKGLRYSIDLEPVLYFNNYVEKREVFSRNEMDYAEWHDLITWGEGLGARVYDKPLYSYLRKRSTTPDIFSEGDEFVVENINNFGFSGGSMKKLILKEKAYFSHDSSVFFDLEIQFVPLSGPERFEINISVDYRGGETATQTITVNKEASSYFSFHLAAAISPKIGNYGKIELGLIFQIEINKLITKRRIDKILENVPIWDNDVETFFQVECEELSPSSNCSLTTDFGVNLISHGAYVGAGERDSVPGHLWDNEEPAIDTDCWVPGISISGSGATSCNHCKSVKDKISGKFDLLSTYQRRCYNSASNMKSKTSNCEVFDWSYPFACNRCEDGFALNFNFAPYRIFTTNCIQDSECVDGLPQIFFFEKNFNGILRKFCTSCPENCQTCDKNLTCGSCTSSNSFLNDISKCQCKVQNCKNCTQEACEICSQGFYKHVEKTGDVTCRSQNCDPGFALDPNETPPPNYSPVCRPCSVEGCSDCSNNFYSCDACFQDYDLQIDKSCLSNIPLIPPSSKESELEVVSCRSPFVLDLELNQCLDCSKVSLTEKKEVVCSMAKNFTFFDISDKKQINEKNRVYEIKIDNKSFISEEEFNNSFEIETIPDLVKFEFKFEKDNKIKVKFNKFVQNQEIKFILKNSTLEENFINKTSSISKNILINRSKIHKFPIKNSSFYTEEFLEKSSWVGKILGSILKFTTTEGVSIVITTLAFNLKISGSVTRAIQFIYLFEKLRFVNHDFKNLLGVLMKAFYEAYSVKYFKEENLNETSKIGFDMFRKLKISPFAYKNKPFKIALTAVILVIGAVVYFLGKLVQKNSRKFKVIKIGKIVNRLVSLFLSNLTCLCLW